MPALPPAHDVTAPIAESAPLAGDADAAFEPEVPAVDAALEMPGHRAAGGRVAPCRGAARAR